MTRRRPQKKATVSTSYLRLLTDAFERSSDAGQALSQMDELVQKEHQEFTELLKRLEGQEHSSASGDRPTKKGKLRIDTSRRHSSDHNSQQFNNVVSGVATTLKPSSREATWLGISAELDTPTVTAVMSHVYGPHPCQHPICNKIRRCESHRIIKALELYPKTQPNKEPEKALVRAAYKKPSLHPSELLLTDVQMDQRYPVTSGAFGDIYKGYVQGRAVCLKVLRKTASNDNPVRRLSREVSIWSQLSHTNVLPFYGISRLNDSRVALVSPWMDRGNIIEYLKAQPDVDRLLMVLDVASGLSYLHSNQIVHGDLKGENILVTGSARACLADFGLSFKVNTAISTASSLQRDGPTRWMAPELMDVGEAQVSKTEASDIYALAMSSLEIFTGSKPFCEIANDAHVVITVVKGGRPQRPGPGICKERRLTDDVWGLLETCWRHKAPERLTAAEVCEQLSRLMDGRPDVGWKGHLHAHLPSEGFNHPGSNPTKTIDTLHAFEAVVQQLLSQDINASSDDHTQGEFIRFTDSEPVSSPIEISYPDARWSRPNSRMPSLDTTPSRKNSMEIPSPQAGGEDDVLAIDDAKTPTATNTAGGSDGVREKWHLEVKTKLSVVFQDVQQYKQVLHSPRSLEQKQELLDLLQTLLDDPQLDAHLRHNLVVAIQRFCKSSNIYPKCFCLGEGVITLLGDPNRPADAGSFADIFKGKFQDHYVCLKFVRLYQESRVEYALKRFYSEAILWGQLSHPNLLPFYGVYNYQSRLCLVSPWAKNGDISTYLERNPRVNRILLARDIAIGLAYLHEKDIIHGDVKGPNVLVSDCGRACVADFGLSSVTDTKILTWTSNSSAASKGGSIRWQAPELYGVDHDDVVYNSKYSDIYAWACVCYEIFIGQVPFYEFKRDATVILHVGRGQHPKRPDESSPSWKEWGLTETIWCLMQRCWAATPEQRPTAAEVVTTLTQEAPQDGRPDLGWGNLSPAHLKRASINDFFPSHIDIDTLLRGTMMDEQGV